MRHLVFVQSAGLVRIDGDVLDAPIKWLDGIEAYAERFDGRVSVVFPAHQPPFTSRLGMVTTPLSDLTFDVVETDDIAGTLDRLNADIMHLPLEEPTAHLIGRAAATVATVEHTGLTRLEMGLAQPHTPLDRLRMEVGFRRLGQRLLKIASGLDGIICNGAPAYEAFRHVVPMALRIHDNRVRRDVIERARTLHTTYRGGPMRLGFSGRFTQIKGPEFAVALQRELAARGEETSLELFGGGPMEQQLRSDAGPRTSFGGYLDFDTEWCERVPRSVDVMIQPHVQSDPACTFLEVAGMGVPIVGFDNAQFVDLVELGHFGWPTPMRSVQGLADNVQELIRNPSEVARASAAGFDFMTDHCFEAEFDARILFMNDVLDRVARPHAR